MSSLSLEVSSLHPQRLGPLGFQGLFRGHCHEYLNGAVLASTELDAAIIDKLRSDI